MVMTGLAPIYLGLGTYCGGKIPSRNLAGESL